MKTDLSGKTIVVLGFARQGMALSRFAVQNGAKVIVSDLRERNQLQENIEEMQGLDIDYVLGEHPLNLLDGADLLAVSGGVPVDVPLVHAARQMGIPVTNDSFEFFLRCPAMVAGITGSAGKTTTTALLGEIGRASGRKTWVGGNIGRPLISDLHEMESGDLVVQELSSFQLELWTHSPPVAAVLNITPNHLDRHRSMAEYSDAKANIIRHQAEQDLAILAADDPGAMALAPLVKGRLRTFSVEHPVDDGAYVENGAVWLRQSSGAAVSVMAVEDVQLRGRHNLLNICAAVALADSVNISAPVMAEAIGAFTGVAHRLERVAVINGVTYVNDSIATAPERALAAVASFDEPLILLAGGKDKKMVWTEWAHRVAGKVKQVVLFGALADLLLDTLNRELREHPSDLRIDLANDLPAAVSIAAATAAEGDVVLLAPGGTSYDAYQDFEARGRHFRSLVGAMAGEKADRSERETT